MRETAAVVSVTGALAAVRLETGVPEACFGCMNRECKAAGDKASRNQITAANPFGLPLEPGQAVEIETASSSAVVQAFSALLPPLLGFMAGFFLAVRLFPALGDPARSACGAALMLLSALGVYRYRRRNPVKTMPSVVRILPKAR
jgi:sigma-E factor negative regulatory protein RseC